MMARHWRGWTRREQRDAMPSMIDAPDNVVPTSLRRKSRRVPKRPGCTSL
jgi:hypothetical protein